MAILSFATDIQAKLRGGDLRTTAVLAAAVFCAVSPLDIPQLLLVLVGAVSCALFQPVKVPGTRRPAKSVAKDLPVDFPMASPQVPVAPIAAYSAPKRRPKTVAAESFPTSLRRSPASAPCGGASPSPWMPQVATPSFQPVVAPTFAAVGWDAQVEELVGSLMPTALNRQAMERLAARVRATVQKLVPEAEVVAFASSACLRGGAFGVAVPDVDVVVSCVPTLLSAKLHGANDKTQAFQQKHAFSRQLEKAALRVFTDRLTATGEFKFRRSAFSADEPKVTLLATEGASAIPLDLAVNSATPLHNAALLTECGRIDARARALILLVRRWARDRGVCHAAKGHLSPYCWTLMAMYFLQVGAEEGDQVLPSLRSFKASSRLAGGSDGEVVATPEGRAPSGKARSVGALFRDFLAFYAGRFQAKTEAVSVRSGRRAAPSPRLPLHVVLGEDGRTREVVPSIEDPFEPTRNLACNVTSLGLARWREEITRAASLLSREGEEASVTELLEPWTPPEQQDAPAKSPSS